MLKPIAKIEKANNILDGKEIDIYLPEMLFGVEYDGSPWHSTEGNIHKSLSKYYHRDKFLLARDKGIHLITVFDKDYKEDSERVLNLVKGIVLSPRSPTFVPSDEIVYTNNDYDYGLWLRNFGYVEIGQEEPNFYVY